MERSHIHRHQNYRYPPPSHPRSVWQKLIEISDWVGQAESRQREAESRQRKAATKMQFANLTGASYNNYYFIKVAKSPCNRSMKRYAS